MNATRALPPSQPHRLAFLLAAAGSAGYFGVQEVSTNAAHVVLAAATVLALALVLRAGPVFVTGTLAASFFFDAYLNRTLGAGVTAGRLIGIVAVVSVLRAFARRELRPSFPNSCLPLAALSVWLTLSSSLAFDRNAAVVTDFRYISYFIFAWLLVQVVTTLESLKLVARMVVIAAVAAAAIGIAVALGLTGGPAGTRAHGPVGDPNDFGFVLCAALPPALWLASIAQTGHSRLIARLAALLVVAGVLASLSRGAVVALAVTAIWAVCTRRLPGRHLLSIVGALVCLAGIVYVAAPAVVQRSIIYRQKAASDNIGARLSAWSVAIAQARRYPVTGVGPGNEVTRSDEFALPYDFSEGALTTHNAYLNIAAELGIPGLAMFVTFLAQSARATSRGGRAIGGRQSREEDMIGAMLLLALIGSFFLTSQFYSPIWLAAGLGIALGQIRASDSHG